MAGPMRGRFIPQNPQKYLGNPDKIMGRSSWEFRLFKWLDQTPAVLQWASEEFSIPYLSPFDNKVHQYYPDALVIYKDKYGNLKKEIIEVKPLKETILQPRASERDKMAFILNQAKWKAAARFAEQQGMTFRVITEKTMFANGQTRKTK
jgi:hypothetical protein